MLGSLLVRLKRGAAVVERRDERQRVPGTDVGWLSFFRRLQDRMDRGAWRSTFS